MIEFLSHPINGSRHTLIDHSILVANKTRDILLKTKFNVAEIGFYSGLLHDIGKLNPYYQNLFKVEKETRKSRSFELELVYERVHSSFSAWATSKLLSKKNNFGWDFRDKAVCLINAHHSRLRNLSPVTPKSENYVSSQKGMYENLHEYYKEIKDKEIEEFRRIDWQKCFSEFLYPVKISIDLHPVNKETSVIDFLEISVLFSALLQADRGSFGEWQDPEFDIKLKTENLIKADSALAGIRSIFQEEALQNFDINNNMSILHAPTGIGKTKVFLDLISQIKGIDRVFYFSPLLALTEDFERKVKGIIDEREMSEVLIYNHLFSGSLLDRENKETSRFGQSWLYEFESFNKQFIITTTQRLLITLYSNSASSKLKLASFRNSILIIDEIQTVPKFLLPNLVNVLRILTEYMNSKILLVSATIPYELNKLERIKLSENLLSKYLILTQKPIQFIGNLNVLSERYSDKRVLIMSNTRRKNIMMYDKVTKQITHRGKKILYLSSGIRKKDRIEIVARMSQDIHDDHDVNNFILISTQVVEAGVDISFSKIYREIAPIDNIIQVMGRLNREGENPDASLLIFQNDNNSSPYSEIEYNESLNRLKEITNSLELYQILPEYYETVSLKNKSNENKMTELENKMNALDFDGVWEFIDKKVLKEDGDTVFLPESEAQWLEIKETFLKMSIEGNRLTGFYKKFIGLTATLPKSIKIFEIQDYLDAELLEQNIIMPKFDKLKEIYDEKVGLDKLLR